MSPLSFLNDESLCSAALQGGIFGAKSDPRSEYVLLPNSSLTQRPETRVLSDIAKSNPRL